MHDDEDKNKIKITFDTNIWTKLIYWILFKSSNENASQFMEFIKIL